MVAAVGRKGAHLTGTAPARSLAVIPQPPQQIYHSCKPYEHEEEDDGVADDLEHAEPSQEAVVAVACGIFRWRRCHFWVRGCRLNLEDMS